MISLIRTDSAHTDFQALVSELDKELSIRDGSDHAFYAQFNKITNIPYVVVAYLEEEAVGCGALRRFSEDSPSLEVKRMFVKENRRGQGIASSILAELEVWAQELGFQKCMLETGKNQPEAISLYLKKGYHIIPNYGPYAHVENSICFEKRL